MRGDACTTLGATRAVRQAPCTWTQRAHARASSALYRTFLTREVPAMAAGRYDGLRLAAPTLLLVGTADPVVRARRLGDVH